MKTYYFINVVLTQLASVFFCAGDIKQIFTSTFTKQSKYVCDPRAPLSC